MNHLARDQSGTLPHSPFHLPYLPLYLLLHYLSWVFCSSSSFLSSFLSSYSTCSSCGSLSFFHIRWSVHSFHDYGDPACKGWRREKKKGGKASGRKGKKGRNGSCRLLTTIVNSGVELYLMRCYSMCVRSREEIGRREGTVDGLCVMCTSIHALPTVHSNTFKADSNQEPLVFFLYHSLFLCVGLTLPFLSISP